MIIPGPAAVLSAHVAGVTALALGDYVNRHRLADPEVSQALDELKALGPVSARSPHGRNPADLPVEWSKIDDMTAAAYGVTKRTLRRWASEARIPAYRDGATWRIAALPGSHRPRR